MGALVYFDKAAEHLSFAAAAADLGVTPSAVSHRIAALEGALGQRLFERETRRVRLTPEGTQLADATRQIMEHLRAVTDGLARHRVLRVSVGPYLSSMWLMPRLGAFEQAVPGLRVDLIHVIGMPNARGIDVSIVWENIEPCPPGHGDLFDTATVPVIAPGRLGQSPFWETDLMPIHYRDRKPWRHWLQSAGGPIKYADRGEVLHEPNLVLEAASHGRGVAMGFLPFISEMFAKRRLVAASDVVVPAQRAYRVVVRDPKDSLAASFVDWLRDQARQTVLSLEAI